MLRCRRGACFGTGWVVVVLLAALAEDRWKHYRSHHPSGSCTRVYTLADSIDDHESVLAEVDKTHPAAHIEVEHADSEVKWQGLSCHQANARRKGALEPTPERAV